MFDKLSHKRRFFLVLLILVVLTFAVYKKTYRSIFQYKNQLDSSEKLVENTNTSFDKIAVLESELRALDKVVGSSENPALIQQKILQFITTGKFSVSVVNISDTHKGKAFTVITNKLVLKGTYEHLLKTIYTIEKELIASKIISINFFSKKNYRTHKTELFVELYFQNYGK